MHFNHFTVVNLMREKHRKAVFPSSNIIVNSTPRASNTNDTQSNCSSITFTTTEWRLNDSDLVYELHDADVQLSHAVLLRFPTGHLCVILPRRPSNKRRLLFDCYRGCLKMLDVKMTYHQNSRAWNCRTWKCRTWTFMTDQKWRQGVKLREKKVQF